MKRALGKLLTIVFLLSIGGLAAFALAAVFVSYPLIGGNERGEAEQLRGAYHVHTTASDGSGELAEVALAANKAGLDFVLLTDHNQLRLGDPTFIQGVLLIPGVELSTPWGHLVALGTRRGLSAEERVSPRVIETIASLGGLSVLAHPVQKKQPWTDATLAELADGMELYSGDSMLREALEAPVRNLFPVAGAYLADPLHATMLLVRAQEEAHALLARLSRRSPKLMLCAHDAHGVPPYEVMFATLTMVLPSPREGFRSKDPVVAAGEVLAMIRARKALCAFELIGSSEGFAIEGLSANRTARVGDKLRIQLPVPHPTSAQVRVRGPARLEGDGRTLALEGEGAVLVEVWVEAPGPWLAKVPRPWIVASPFKVEA